MVPEMLDRLKIESRPMKKSKATSQEGHSKLVGRVDQAAKPG
jgi:hypothetical protein